MPFKKYLRAGQITEIFQKFELLPNKIITITNDSRGRCYTRISSKLNYIAVSPKAFCHILKMFLNDKKLQLINQLIN